MAQADETLPIFPFIPYNLFPTTALALRSSGCLSVGFVHDGFPFDDTDDRLLPEAARSIT